MNPPEHTTTFYVGSKTNFDDYKGTEQQDRKSGAD